MSTKVKVLLFLMITIISLTACGRKNDEIGIVTTEYHKLSIIIPEDIVAKDFVLSETGVWLLTNNYLISINYNGIIDGEISLAGSESFTCLSIDEYSNFNILATNNGEDGTTNLTVHSFKSDGSRLAITVLEEPLTEEEDNPYVVNFLTANGNHYVQTMYGVYVYNEAGEPVLTARDEQL